MIDLQLTDGDLVFDEIGNLQVVQDAAAVAQRIYLTLIAQRGGWFLDNRFGQPWREKILVRNPNLVEIGALLRAAILAVEGVTGLNSFDLSFDVITGNLRLDFEATTNFGAIVAQSEAEDIAALLTNLLLAPVGGIA